MLLLLILRSQDQTQAVLSAGGNLGWNPGLLALTPSDPLAGEERTICGALGTRKLDADLLDCRDFSGSLTTTIAGDGSDILPMELVQALGAPKELPGSL